MSSLITNIFNDFIHLKTYLITSFIPNIFCVFVVYIYCMTTTTLISKYILFIFIFYLYFDLTFCLK